MLGAAAEAQRTCKTYIRAQGLHRGLMIFDHCFRRRTGCQSSLRCLDLGIPGKWSAVSSREKKVFIVCVEVAGGLYEASSKATHRHSLQKSMLFPWDWKLAKECSSESGSLYRTPVKF